MSILLFWQESGFEYVVDGLIQATGAAVTFQTRNYSYKADNLIFFWGHPEGARRN